VAGVQCTAGSCRAVTSDGQLYVENTHCCCGCWLTGCSHVTVTASWTVSQSTLTHVVQLVLPHRRLQYATTTTTTETLCRRRVCRSVGLVDSAVRPVCRRARRSTGSSSHVAVSLSRHCSTGEQTNRVWWCSLVQQHVESGHQLCEQQLLMLVGSGVDRGVAARRSHIEAVPTSTDDDDDQPLDTDRPDCCSVHCVLRTQHQPPTAADLLYSCTYRAVLPAPLHSLHCDVILMSH